MTKREHLSFDEQIIVAYAHYVRGVEQQVLAAIFCVNHGRVSEACKAIKDVIEARAVTPFPVDKDPLTRQKVNA
jgi:hypothetical protein